jgi:hypothetical protein
VGAAVGATVFPGPVNVHVDGLKTVGRLVGVFQLFWFIEEAATPTCSTAASTSRSAATCHDFIFIVFGDGMLWFHRI